MIRDFYPQAAEIEDRLIEYDLPIEMTEVIGVIYGLTETAFDPEIFDRTVSRFREECDYSMINTTAACLYTALLSVLYENPLAHIGAMIECVPVVRNAGFHSRVSNMMGLTLIGQETVAEARAEKALKIYHSMHAKHSFITGEDDYLAAMYISGMEASVPELIIGMETIYSALGKRSFNRGSGLQTLSHLILIAPACCRENLTNGVDAWHQAFRQHGFKLKSHQWPVYVLLACAIEDVEGFFESLTDYLERKGHRSRMDQLEWLVAILETCKQLGTAFDHVESDYIKTTLLMTLTAYLFKEKLM